VALRHVHRDRRRDAAGRGGGADVFTYALVTQLPHRTMCGSLTAEAGDASPSPDEQDVAGIGRSPPTWCSPPVTVRLTCSPARWRSRRTFRPRDPLRESALAAAVHVVSGMPAVKLTHGRRDDRSPARRLVPRERFDDAAAWSLALVVRSLLAP
jgi:hypothetical protein